MTTPPPVVSGARASGWRRLGLGYAHAGAWIPWSLVVLGLSLEFLSTPPGPFPWLVLAADAPFLWLLGRGSAGRWKRWVFLYGVLHYALGIWWLSWIHPVQVAGASVFLAPIYLAAGAAIRLLYRRGVPWLLVVPTILVLEEMLRTVYMGGLPLPSRSLAFTASVELTAASAWLGAYLLCFVAALASAWIAEVPTMLRKGGGWRRVVLSFAACAALVLMVYGLGFSRLAQYWRGEEDGRVRSTAPRMLVAVQGNIAQGLKHSREPGAAMKMLRAHVRLSQAALASEASEGREVFAVLWPETMVPWPSLDGELAARFPDAWANEVRVAQHVADVPSELPRLPRFLIGVIYLFRRGSELHLTPEWYGTHDSLALLDIAKVPGPAEPVPAPPGPGGVAPWIVNRHDKHILVPGGEYTPLGDLLSPLRWFRNFVSVIPELDPGAADQRPFDLLTESEPGGTSVAVRAGTVICFELLFPRRCRAWRRAGAGVLLGAANYGWFGPTAFRAQLRAVAALRAAETATTVVVAGNTGPTVCYDPVGRPFGRFHEAAGHRLDPPEADRNTFREGWLAAPLLVDRLTTTYVRWGDGPWLMLGLFAAFWGLVGRGRRREPGKAKLAVRPAGRAHEGENH